MFVGQPDTCCCSFSTWTTCGVPREQSDWTATTSCSQKAASTDKIRDPPESWCLCSGNNKAASATSSGRHCAHILPFGVEATSAASIHSQVPVATPAPLEAYLDWIRPIQARTNSDHSFPKKPRRQEAKRLLSSNRCCCRFACSTVRL